jgi:1-deoxy-D-xylulose-5-phosphate reductoisomerase
MRLPIQFALTYPQRQPALTSALDLKSVGTLTFEAPDLDTFPCLRVALDTAKIRGTACAVMNAANEAAVALFLEDKITFHGIHDAIRRALDRIKNIPDATVDDILAADAEAREIVLKGL